MRSTPGIIPLIGFLLLLPLVACQPAEDGGPAAGSYDEAQWAGLQAAKASVDEKRAEREELREQLAALRSGVEPAEPAEPAEGAEGAEGGDATAPATAEDLEARITALTGEIDALTDQLAREVPEFMNQYFEIPLDDQGRVDETALTPVQREAIEMKVDEDIVLAQEYISKGGEYEKALQIYEQAKILAPSYQPLLDAEAQALSDRYMTEDRFAKVEKKMTQDQVRALLGQVKRSNMRDYPEKQIKGWFYRKDDGGAAGVFFKEKTQGSDEWLVYSFDYEAVKPQVIGGEASTEDAEAPPEE